MKITKISITKSKTIGFLDQSNKTRFKKLQVGAEAELGTEDKSKESYQSLSKYIDDCLMEEINNK